MPRSLLPPPARHADRPAGTRLPAQEGLGALLTRFLADMAAEVCAYPAAHHISVSYLHRLFRTGGTTVTELIRRGRLEGARRDLADRRLRETPVHRIAARWGFRDHSAFTRAFRTAYGVPPREYRET